MRHALPLLVLAACNLGTLDSLSEDTAGTGTDEVGSTAEWYFANFDTATDAEVKAKMAAMDGIIDRAGGLPVQVTIIPLTQADVATVMGKTQEDLTKIQGMLVVTEIPCALDKVEKLDVATNQTDLYPKLYDAYTRTYTSSAGDYFARTSPQLRWTTDYTATALSLQYEAVVDGRVRWVPDANPHGGGVLWGRSFLPTPAKILSGDGEFAQDYQIEVFYERNPGKTTHFYGMWRQFRLNDLTSQAQLYIGFTMGNLVDFDTRTGIVCKNGSPVPVTQ
jgi:hypothetical protein